ncbi:hypothetical protein MKW94_024135 [Papaver nudicaule]|uniref:Uncharacterized protein n=1 Tax=Papaver nudicaule TaxID=74823 RepID=A0AA41RN91_PAPNU|nr:hypothetical protein [Papaver nudicaule]
MARNFISIFSTVFFFVMIIMASFTAQMASVHGGSDDLISAEDVRIPVHVPVNVEVKDIANNVFG